MNINNTLITLFEKIGYTLARGHYGIRNTQFVFVKPLKQNPKQRFEIELNTGAFGVTYKVQCRKNHKSVVPCNVSEQTLKVIKLAILELKHNA